jgi:hypothetical protein
MRDAPTGRKRNRYPGIRRHPRRRLDAGRKGNATLCGRQACWACPISMDISNRTRMR